MWKDMCLVHGIINVRNKFQMRRAAQKRGFYDKL